MTEKRPTFILAGNGPYDNRGCEAIVRGTVKILRHYYEDPIFLCISNFSSNEQFQKQCIEETDSSITHKKMNIRQSKYDIDWLIHKSLEFVNPNIYKKWIYRQMLPYLSSCEAVLSVGGDNYSLDYGIPQIFTYLDDIVMDSKENLVIWGASVGPFTNNQKYEKYIIEHLRNISAIFARESATTKYLKENSANANIYSVADPAFLLKAEEPKEVIEIEEGAIGINLSPLMAKYVTAGDVNKWIEIASKVVSLIAKRTGRTIYLIPHVTTPSSNDYEFLTNVSESISEYGIKIILISPIYNASETKWIISKMLIFAGARTHSTIAALSSCVPTLSFSYSIKAKGINDDIFGHNNYLLNPRDLEPNIVVDKIEYMIENHKMIRRELCIRNLHIQNKALLAGGYLQTVLKNNNKHI
jgi:polysaccharide pyruvyl transferase WcaK-like protein